MATLNEDYLEKRPISNDANYKCLQRDENISPKIKNIKYRKSRVAFNLTDFIIVKRKQQKAKYKCPYIIFKNKPKSFKKQRHRLSKLKKSILKMRAFKHGKENDLKSIEIKSEVDRVACTFSHLTLNTTQRDQLHSRRFREYCDNFSSKELCILVEKVLRDLFYFQKRTYQANQCKGRYRRRIVIGFREVQRQLKLDKLKLVVIATDCEKCDIEGGLDTVIESIKTECENRRVPCAFVLQRRQISYALFIRAPVGCVGIKDYDGVQDAFHSLIKTLEKDKCSYKEWTEKNEKPLQVKFV